MVVVDDMVADVDFVPVDDVAPPVPDPPVPDPPVPLLPPHPWLAAPTATNAVTAANGPARCQNSLSLASVMLPPFE